MRTLIPTTVNEIGITQIHDFLAKNHKLGREHFTPSMLKAWSMDAEFQLSEGNPPAIELKHWDSIDGITKTFTIDSNGIEFTEIDIEE